MTIVKADGDDLVHSDGKTAEKASELIRLHKDEPFFIAVGFVRPHVPFVAPKKYFVDYPWEDIQVPDVIEGDWDDEDFLVVPPGQTIRDDLTEAHIMKTEPHCSHCTPDPDKPQEPNE